MTEERKHEQKPWSPTIDSEPLFNAFEDPQRRNAELRDPVALMDEDSVEEPVVDQAPPSEVPAAANESK